LSLWRWRHLAHGSTAASVFKVERARLFLSLNDGPRLKFDPFANISREEIAAIYAHGALPPHPLKAAGYFVRWLHARHKSDLTG
jgi:hypothetical protein